LYLSSSSSLFFLTWAFHRSLASKVMPRYLAVLAYGMFWLLIVTGMCSRRLLVKLIWAYLVTFSWMFHFFVHVCIWFMAVCSFPVDSSLLVPTASIAVSIANVATVKFPSSGKCTECKSLKWL
jgi:hypothetical protein